MQRVGAQGERLRRERGRRGCSQASQPGWVPAEGQPGNLAQERHAPLDSNSSSGGNVEGEEAAGSEARPWAQGAV